jgi:hypothetical protein
LAARRNGEPRASLQVQILPRDWFPRKPQDGSHYVALKDRVLRAFVGIPNLDRTDNLVPSLDGRTLYYFDQRGKHIKTINTVNGITEYAFGYSKDTGLLESIADKSAHRFEAAGGSAETEASRAPEERASEN